MDYSFAEPVVPASFKIDFHSDGSYCASRWYLRGSNDKENWVDLYTAEGCQGDVEDVFDTSMMVKDDSVPVFNAATQCS